MTQIDTKYSNLGPEARAVSALPADSFFREGEGDTVYRVMFQHAGTVYALCLNDLSHVTFRVDSIVIPVEVNKISLNVELAQ